MNKKKLLIIIVIVAVVVVVAILLDTMLANHRPVITSLEAEPEIVFASETCQIVCTASDSDGDELSYNWSASGGERNGEGATVTWTAPNSKGSYDVTVVVTDSHGSSVTKSATVTVRTNSSPNIASLATDADWSHPLGILQVNCNATDPDGDELSYEWSASGGNITGTGAAVNWTAPQEIGVYNITVVVSDSYGGSDTRTVPISVAPDEPPIIEQLSITAKHCYLKKYSGGYYVGKEQMYNIECIVAETGMELSYEWSCTGGVLSGEGSLVTWTAPNTTGKVTITVIVSDIAANMASKNLVLSVVSCSVCTFGC